MKNSQIHEGLPNKEIRDFLSLGIVKSYANYYNRLNEPLPNTNTLKGFDWTIARIKRDIKMLNIELDHVNELKSIQYIIKNQGWAEYDVSDETIKDLDYSLHMNFIGTEEEYNNLMKKL